MAPSTRDIRHISTHLNAADPASRGLTMLELANHELWWGPNFLKLDEKFWPIPAVQPIVKTFTSDAPSDLKYLLKEDELPSTKIFSMLKADPFINRNKYFIVSTKIVFKNW